MKKFLFTFAAIITTLFCTCCTPTVDILYNVNIEGCAAGDIVVTFPNGNLNLNGDANINFKYSNDTTVVNNSILLSEALESNDIKVVEFASTVDSEFIVMLKNPELEGSYDIKIHGYAKEPTTGIVIAIDKEFKYPVNE